MFDSKVFNAEKSDYDSSVLFLGQDAGLLDTTNGSHQRLWDLYRGLRGLDWDTNEFDFSPCLIEFKTKDPRVAQAMIQNLGYQWEGDSVAANSIMATMCHYVTHSALKTVWDQVVANENLHATTYSEIIRYSFDSPNMVLQEVLSVKESLRRLKIIGEVMGKAYRIGLELSLGIRSKDDPEVYAAAFLFVVALFLLERVGFNGSFSVTGAIAQTGDYMPICNAVQRVAQDEDEIHVNVDKYVIETEMKTARGMACWKANRKLIDDMIAESLAAEVRWTNFQKDSGSVVPGVGWDEIITYSKYNVADAADTLRRKVDFKAPTVMPLPYMEKWLNVSKTQGSAMEQDLGQYLVGVVRRDDHGKKVPFNLYRPVNTAVIC